MKIQQAICPLQQFNYMHYGIRGAGVCNHYDVPILYYTGPKVFVNIKKINFYFKVVLLVSFRETT